MKISALNEQGKPVDWWFMYKVPQLNGGGVGIDNATGYEYIYYDSEIDKSTDIKKKTQLKSPFVIDKGEGALNLTLDSVFKQAKPASKTTGWILYNDEMPASTKLKDNAHLGHTKGVIAFDTKTETAYWLLHSWPKFAEPNAEHDPTPKYGQTYMCISLDIDTARKIANQMVNHQEPQVYFPNTADLTKDDDLFKLTQPIDFNATADSDVLELSTIGGMPFKVIAKNQLWNKDFWNDLVGPTLKDDMDVETWIRGPIAPIADSDGIHKTFDIKYINLGPLGTHWAWPETHDHAKWGITLNSPWVCVGDINRMISQRKRGGCTIAFQNKNLWQGLSKSGLLLAPPGHTRTQAHQIIANTHNHEAEAPVKTKVKNSVSKKTIAKKAATKTAKKSSK
jgi:deoxyribonuclease-2